MSTDSFGSSLPVNSRGACPKAKEADTTITTKVKAKFVEDKEVSAAAINVETFKGVVQLSGFANSRHEADKATELARHIKGVKSVKNDIRLKAAQ